MYNNSSYNEELFDALLTIAFNRLLDEELAEMPSDEELAKMFPVPQKQARKMQRYAKRLKYRAPMPIVYLRRVAVACLVMLSLAFAAFATVPVIREAIKETVVTWYEKYVQFDFAKSNDLQSEVTDIYDLNIGYIPEGFELVEVQENRKHLEYYFKSNTDEYLIVGIYSSCMAEFVGDIELSEYEELMINGNKAYMLYNAETKDGTLIFGNNQYTVYISSVASKNIVKQMAESIN